MFLADHVILLGTESKGLKEASAKALENPTALQAFLIHQCTHTGRLWKTQGHSKKSSPHSSGLCPDYTSPFLSFLLHTLTCNAVTTIKCQNLPRQDNNDVLQHSIYSAQTDDVTSYSVLC